MSFLRNVLVVGILVGAAYGYARSHPESRAASWGLGLLDDVIGGLSDRDSEDGPLVDHPSEIFSFEITPEWIMDRWEQVSTGLSDERYQGYRVALVTGPGATDLAGALTYQFDRRENLRRITFVGTTGDARYLVDWVKRRFGFRWQNQQGTTATYGPGRLGRPRGYLHVTPKRGLFSEEAPREFEVELVVGR